MATPFDPTSSQQPPSWDGLAARARSALPPTDIDVRADVRRSIENGTSPAVEPKPPAAIWDDLLTIARLPWLRGALAAGAVAAAALLVAGTDAMRDLGDAAQLVGPLLADF